MLKRIDYPFSRLYDERMSNTELIHEIVSRFIATYHPQKIYLFGSQAWGSPSEDSDYDFCVILKSSNTSQAERIREGMRSLKGIPVPVDLLVLTEEEVKDRINHPSTLIHQVCTKGKKLYDAA